MSRSGYYDWRKRHPSHRNIMNEHLDKQIQYIYDEHHGRYGYRRIMEELKENNVAISLERTRRRMRHLGIKGIQSRKFKYTTNNHHCLPKRPNLLNQNFHACNPNEVWVGDITYLKIAQKWFYLAVIIDLYSRKVIGWKLKERMNTQLVIDALKLALSHRNYPKNVIIHHDQGSQYCSTQYQRLIKAYGLTSSMSGKGNCYDNAVCESFFHTLKVELVYQKNFQNIEKLRQEIFWYIEAYYNRKRKHSRLGYLSPVNFELTTLKMVA